MFEKKFGREVSVAHVLEKGYFDQVPGRLFILVCSALFLAVLVDGAELYPPAKFWQPILQSIALVHLIRVLFGFVSKAKTSFYNSFNAVILSLAMAMIAISMATITDSLIAAPEKIYVLSSIFAGLIIGVHSWMQVPSVYVHSESPQSGPSVETFTGDDASMEDETGESEIYDLSGKDLEVASYHEAGHAMTLALLPSAMVKKAYVNIGNSQNTMTYSPSFDRSITPNRLSRWRLLMLLAGPVATNKVYGCSMSGAFADYEEWTDLAANVLTNEMTNGWTPLPKNKFEAIRNEEILSDLKEKQLQALKAFFEINESIHFGVSNYLMDHRYMNADTMAMFFAHIEVPDEISKLMGDSL